MKRIHISLPESYAELLELWCKNKRISKSSFIRLLIAEHENTVPVEIKYQELIKEINGIQVILYRLILSDKLTENDKLLLYEKLNHLKNELRANLAQSEK